MSPLQFFRHMDEKHIVRLVVLVGPGVLLHKVMLTIDAPPVFRAAANVLLIAGIFAFVSWRFITKKVGASLDPANRDDAEIHEEELVDEPAPFIPGILHANLMNELVLMCGGQADAALELVKQEIEVNPNINYLAAVELAHRRKDVTRIRNQSEG